MLKQSIRWRLALSFAGLALLVTLALGAVLLGILRNYYGQQELRYLEDNAVAVSAFVADMLRQNPSPDTLQAQVEGLTFLAESRVRLLDTQNNEIADSGSPLEDRMFMVSFNEQGDQIIRMQSIETPPPELSDVIPFTRTIAMGEDVGGGTTEGTMLVAAVASDIPTSTLLFTGTDLSPQIPGMEAVPAVRTIYGVALERDENTAGARSPVKMTQPVQAAGGELWGYLELSEGPAYGTQIVRSAAIAWGIAGALAVLLAATVGWLMSRNLSAPLLALTATTARMAAGDLSTRAPATDRADEFGALARAFNQMADRVEETVTTLREFVSDAAHELHTPLTALHTNLELAGDSDAVRRAQGQVARLEALSEGLLDLSRIEAGAPTFAPVDVVALVQETVEIYASQAEQSNLTFTSTMPDGPAWVQGDAAHLRRALTNLLDNALKFTPAGGAVRGAVAGDPQSVAIHIEDTGIGIPEADLPHLFNRFHRGRNTAEYPGSGLGLAIVKAIAEEHHGQIEVNTAETGAHFTLRLPLIERGFTGGIPRLCPPPL